MRYFVRLSSSIVLLQCMVAVGCAQGQTPLHLKRSVDTLAVVEMEISTETAHYRPMFGAGDADSAMVKGVKRFGYLRIDPGGRSQTVNYGREELVYYVLEGTGLLRYEGREVPISKNDFFYVPIDTEHGFSNPRADTLNMIVMGFPVPEDTKVEPTVELQIASADDVPFQVLGSHGATVSYRLLLGTTESERDRLAAAYQIKSMYVMDFAPAGTNQVHRHGNAEEIYFVLQGRGEMVAGGPGGEPERYAVEAGDVFFFSRNSPVGFFSGTEEGQPHARILAIRSKYPDQE